MLININFLPAPYLFRKIAVILLLCTGFTFNTPAQQQGGDLNGKLSGTVLDSLSGQPVEYAAVSLTQTETNKTVNGCTTDSKGSFALTNVQAGTYKITIDFIGYQTTSVGGISITSANPNVVMKSIRLRSSQAALKTVVIEADKSMIENKIDKMVYNAEKDLTAQSGVATDILKKIPQVDVDVDGNVELQGNSNIRFLINGKPSTVFGNNIADVLQSIPASQISSIEVITSPGAKYDAEGTGGIINIILKKSQAQGVNGSVSLSGGTRLENGSFNLNIRKGKFGVHAFASGNAQLQSTVLTSMNRTSKDSVSRNSLLQQDGTSDFHRNGFQSGVSFDWELSPRDNITGSVNYNYNDNANNGSATRRSMLMDGSGNTLSDVSDRVMTNSSFQLQAMDYALSYKRTFKKEGQELELQYNSSYGNNLSNYSQTQTHIPTEYLFNGSNGSNPGIQNETNIALDYVQPLGKDLIFETGLKTVLDQTSGRSDVSLLNTSSGNYDYSNAQSASFNYNRNVYAGYVSATFKLFRFLDVKTGCRYEYTDTQADFSNAPGVILNPYGSFVPSAIIAHTFKNNQTLKLGYAHRIQRPDYRDLNPFVNASDPRNVTTGNPGILPEISDKIELTYSKSFNKGTNINFVLFARLNTDDIQSYTRYYPTYKIGDSIYTNVAVSTRENIGHENNYGANFFISVPAGSKITLRSNISAFQRYIFTDLPSGGNTQGFNYRINLNAAYQINSKLAMEVFGNYNSPRTNAQGTMPAFFTYNFAIRQQLFHKKASIALTATNPFSEYIDQTTTLAGSNFNLTSTRQLPYRSFGFNFTYKFGKMEFKKTKEAEDPNLNAPADN
ncbi:MAG: TonB-dependent receptor domain-containing protein [Bacteroidia bacterium]